MPDVRLLHPQSLPMSERSRPLTSAEVTRLTAALRKALPSQFRETFASLGFDIRRHVQCTDLASQLKATREARGHSVPEVARILRVAHYKIATAETGQFRSLGLPTLKRYVAFLELADWFEAWQSSNPRALREPPVSRPRPSAAVSSTSSRKPRTPRPGAA